MSDNPLKSGEGAPPEVPSTEGLTAMGFPEGVTIEEVGWLENKGYSKSENPALDMLRGYRSHEKLYGEKRESMLEIPDFTDAEAASAFYAKIGRPESPDDYKFELTAGNLPENETILPQARAWFHEAGLRPDQANMLAAKFDAYVEEAAAGIVAQSDEQGAADIAELKREWGSKYEEKVLDGRRFMRAAGWSDDDVDAVDRSLGTGKLLRAAAKFGGMLREGGTPDAEGFDSGLGDSAQGARAEIASLQQDAAFMKRYMEGDAGAKAKLTELFRRAHPGDVEPLTDISA